MDIVKISQQGRVCGRYDTINSNTDTLSEFVYLVSRLVLAEGSDTSVCYYQ